MGVMLLFIGGSVDIEIMVASCFSRCNHLGCNVAHPQDADLQLAWGARMLVTVVAVNFCK